MRAVVEVLIQGQGLEVAEAPSYRIAGSTSWAMMSIG